MLWFLLNTKHGITLKGTLLALPECVRLGWKWRTLTLAFFTTEIIMSVCYNISLNSCWSDLVRAGGLLYWAFLSSKAIKCPTDLATVSSCKCPTREPFWRRKLSTVDLLINICCSVKKKNIVSVWKGTSELVSTWRSTVLSLPLQLRYQVT